MHLLKRERMLDYIEILKKIQQLQNYDSNVVEDARSQLSDYGEAIVPCLLEYAQTAQNPWEARYQVLAVIDEIGITDQKYFKTFDEWFPKEKDAILQKKIAQILMNAAITQTGEIYETREDRKEPEGAWKIIPSFESDEIVEIKDMLKQEKISFRETITIHGHPDLPNYLEEHALVVPNSAFDKTVSLIQDYLGFDSQDSAFTGECPGCGVYCEEEERCPECGLNLEIDPLIELVDHPFTLFLYEQGRLDEALENHPKRKLLEAQWQRMKEEFQGDE